MDSKRSSFKKRATDQKDLDSVNDYPTFSDLMREQNDSSIETNKAVHFRRDLDSLG